MVLLTVFLMYTSNLFWIWEMKSFIWRNPSWIFVYWIKNISCFNITPLYYCHQNCRCSLFDVIITFFSVLLFVFAHLQCYFLLSTSFIPLFLFLESTFSPYITIYFYRILLTCTHIVKVGCLSNQWSFSFGFYLLLFILHFIASF